MTPITPTKTTLVIGFLGAGKTTLINALLKSKPAAQTWALLINEFGKIGVDVSLIESQENVAIKEVSGGCICCSSQLPMQVALVRLLAKKPNHLLIEPTGLVKAGELLAQFSAVHWQNTLKLTAVVAVLNALQWQQEKYRNHADYQAHISHADVVVISQSHALSDTQKAQLSTWIAALNPKARMVDFEQIEAHWSWLFAWREAAEKTAVYPLLTTSHLKTQTSQTTYAPPYHYCKQHGDYQVAGWQLPAIWIFDEVALTAWLLSLVGFERIKGVLHTSTGWLSVNITPSAMTLKNTTEQLDTRLELIRQDTSPIDWQEKEAQLLALRQDNNAQHDKTTNQC